MKHLLPITFLLLPLIAASQITITENDMPSSGNDFITTNCVLDFTIDVNETGANHSWDYSSVVPLTSAGDTFVNIPLLYFLFFLQSNLADKNGVNFSFGGFGLQDVYTMYKKSSSQFEIDGYGGTFTGLPIPLPYSSKDVLYRFPLDYNNEDSSDASVSYSFPGLFFYSQQRHRVNQVDGWGTITTPVGAFNALRVKSTITDVDSFYLDTLGFGTGVTLKSYEYKWLAQNGGTPVFQLGAQDIFGTPVITQVAYQDTAFVNTGNTGIDGVKENFGIRIFPNPSFDFVLFDFNHHEVTSILIYDELGRRMASENFTSPHASYIVNVRSWQNGMYFTRVIENGKSSSSSFVVNH